MAIGFLVRALILCERAGIREMGEAMRAAVFRGVGEPLAIETVPDPEPAEGEVVIKVGRCGVCGTDLHMTESHGASYPAGTVPGHELAGEIVALGRGVSRFRIGDRVTALSVYGCGTCAACTSGFPFVCAQMAGLEGGFGQYTRAPEHGCLLLPRTLSLADGALVEPLACSLHGVRTVEITPETRILVLGAGPVGLGAVFWAKQAGARRIAVAAHSRRGEALALTLGASRFVDPEADRAAAVTDALGGPPDVVFECVGRPGLLGEAIALARFRGTVVVLSMCMEPDSIIPAMALMKEVTLRFAVTYTGAEFEESADTLAHGAVEARAMVTGTVSLDALPAAFEGLRAGSRHCKLMVDPWA
jgi:(R,R)-butanediol dehydrogenase/meso-butanediol dehydrogenase/diacetyl reductase